MQFDLIIAGSGLVGATLACCLKDSDLKIGILDKHLPLNQDALQKNQAHALALSPPSVRCLQILNIWPKVATHASAISTVHVSKQNHFGITKICATDFNMPALGYVINADTLQFALNEMLYALPQVTRFYPDEIAALEPLTTHWNLQLKSGQKIKTSLLVAADGTDSPLRNDYGIEVDIQDHQQTALVVNVRIEGSHQGMAFERFTNEGSIALLPFGEQQMKCVWVVPTSKGNFLQTLPNQVLLSNIQTTFGHRLGNLISLSERAQYPLRTLSAHSIYAHRFVLIGNAAHTLHPVAAQGFNLGLRDAASLAEHLIFAEHQQHDVGSLEVLRSYATERIPDHRTTLHQFSHPLINPNIFQWLGILGCELFPFVKRKIMKLGSASHSPLPALCRGIELASAIGLSSH